MEIAEKDIKELSCLKSHHLKDNNWQLPQISLEISFNY